MAGTKNREDEDPGRRVGDEPAASLSRRDLLKTLGIAGGGALLYQASMGLGAATTLKAPAQPLPEGDRPKLHVVILGAGVGGLVAAYELRKRGHRCTVVEARGEIGGRSLTLRQGDELIEEPPKPYLDDHRRVSRQECKFEPSTARGYDRPYLNAGPGRIPSAHTHVLDLCKELRAPLEVYVMESRSNLVRAKEPPRVNRHVANDARGWIAQELFRLAGQVPDLSPDQRKQLENLLIQFGSLGNGMKGGGTRGVYADRAGKYARSTRAGFTKLPEVAPGVPVKALRLDEVLATEFWESRFYQPEDFLWQPTLFQPVGGMDRIVHELAARVGDSNIRTGSPVTSIRFEGGKWHVQIAGRRSLEPADACISNIPLPLLESPLGNLARQPFPDDFKKALEKIFDLEATGTKGFLAPTCKVGWQARRALWQEPDEAVGRVVPIFGGISWTTHPLTQIWYPSDRFFDELGVLTGAYNFGNDAATWGDYSPAWRLASARAGAQELGGKAFSDGLGAGLSIAWQNIEHIRGGWAQWENVDPEMRVRVKVYNDLVAGDPKNRFFLCGDQMSQLPGWQEGAVVSAHLAVREVLDGTFRPPQVDSVPDSRVMVEGRMPVEIDE